jgi:hypothetical protein
MSQPTDKQMQEIVLAINRTMGFREDKNPKKTVWELLKYLAVFSRKTKPIKRRPVDFR